jgi:hypothetical protein
MNKQYCVLKYWRDSIKSILKSIFMDYWMRRYFYVQDLHRLPLEIYFREEILGVLLKMIWLRRHLVFEFFFTPLLANPKRLHSLGRARAKLASYKVVDKKCSQEIQKFTCILFVFISYNKHPYSITKYSLHEGWHF